MRAWWLIPIVALLSLASPDEARADACGDCKAKCRKEGDKCKKAAPKALCKVPGVKGVCTMFKNAQCPAAAKICRSVNCGLLPSCSPGPSDGGGQVSGDPHFYSFDRSRFDYQGAGEFVLARSQAADIEVHARFAPYGSNASVIAMLAVRTGGHVIVFERDRPILVDGSPVEASEASLYIDRTIALTPATNKRFILSTGEHELWVRVGSSNLDLHIDPDSASRGSWSGLLGDFDGDPANDFRTRDGVLIDRSELTPARLYGDFGASWRVSDDESLLLYRKGEATATFTDEGFPKKHFAITQQSAEEYERARKVCNARGIVRGEALRNCIYDLGATGDDTFADAYIDVPDVVAAHTVGFDGKLGLLMQATGYQGQVVPVFWSGAANENGRLSILDANGKVLSRHATKRITPAELRLPAEVGSYTVQFEQEGQTASQPVTVEPVGATLTAPRSVGGAQPFTVEWTGPLGRGDYISLVQAGATNPFEHLAYVWADRQRAPTFQAPATPGEYEIWYVLQGARSRTVIARSELTVTPPSASVTPPKSIAVGERFPTSWSGPNGRGDYLDLVAAGERDPNRHLHYAWTSKGDGLRLHAPVEPGTYDVRYVATTATGRAVLATAPLVVTDVSVEIKVPASVTASQPFEVSWTGPHGPGDYVSIVEAGETDPHRHLAYRWTNEDRRRKLEAPTEPGTYEVVYVLQGGNGRRILSRSKLVVEAPKE